MEITLEAGEKKPVSLVGFGFYLVKADGPVIVELREPDGRVDEVGYLEEGQGLQGDNRFESVRLINVHGADQTIDVYVGPRRFVDNRNKTEVDAMPAIEFAGAQPVIQAEPNPQKYFGSDSAAISKCVSVTGLQTVVAPAANTDGIVVYQVSAYSAGGMQSVLFDTSAPSHAYDGAVLAVQKMSGGGNTWSGGSDKASFPFYIPPGFGLYHYGGGSGSYSSCVYEVK